MSLTAEQKQSLLALLAADADAVKTAATAALVKVARDKHFAAGNPVSGAVIDWAKLDAFLAATAADAHPGMLLAATKARLLGDIQARDSENLMLDALFLLKALL